MNTRFSPLKVTITYCIGNHVQYHEQGPKHVNILRETCVAIV